MQSGRRLAALLLAAGLAAAGCSLVRHDPKPDPAARAFLDAWARGDMAAAAAATDDPAGAKTTLEAVKDGLSASKGELTLGEVSTSKDTATARYTAAWTLRGVGQPWRYDGELALVKQGSAWTVHWQPTDLHPKLVAGQRLVARRALPERAALLDGAGNPIFTQADVVTVGVQRSKVTNLTALAGTLAQVLQVRAADIVADVSSAPPDAFVQIITLRLADYQQVRARIHDLPGTVFQTGRRLLGPTSRFAQPLLGNVGLANADVLKEVGPGYTGADQLGKSGLQRALNGQLTGTAGVEVFVGGAQVGSVAGTPGTPVRTTLDRAVQTAADAAVATSTTPAAIVAVKPSTGALLAVANNAAAPYDIALTGRYPAGSTFKTITATALLAARVVQPTSVVPCPGTTVVFGKTFHNEDSFNLGNVPLRTAFAHSCNTSFTMLSQRLADGALPSTAAAYGVGSAWNLPVDSFGGSVPAPKDDTEKAADAIGQGRVELSPLAMALVAAAVQRGGAVVPSLIAGTPATPKTGSPPAGPPTAVLPALRDMMRAVVTDGTAKLLATLPGAPVSGKTGTAEFGTATPPQAHAWFIGYRGDFAFAVFVQNGESSSKTAVPMARTFLTALGS